MDRRDAIKNAGLLTVAMAAGKISPSEAERRYLEDVGPITDGRVRFVTQGRPYAIDVRALSGVNPLTPRDIMEIFHNTGVLIYRWPDECDNNPITPLWR